MKEFSKELEYIKNKDLRKSTEILIKKIPDYFFEIAASSTGKYHPSFALGNGGLLRHTKVAVRMAHELLSNPSIGDKYTEHEKDLMIISLIFHDSIKRGIPESEHTYFNHPILAANFIEDNKEEAKLSLEDVVFIKKCISSHMGPWNENTYTGETLPKPETKYENFVHMCDYLASRKFIDVKFNENEIED